MAQRRNNFTVGLTVLIVLAMIIGIILFIGARQPWGEATRPLTVRFAHTLTMPPLKVGGQVLFAGQPVGTIESMWFDKGEYQDEKTGKKRETTFLYVQADVQKRLNLRADCKILPEGPILGGAGMLRISDQGHAAKPLAPDHIVEGRGMGGFAAVTDQLDDIGASLAQELDAKNPGSIMALIKAQLDAGQTESMVAKLVKSLGDLNAITASIRDQLDPRQEKVILSKLHLTLDNINAVTGELRNQMDPNSRSALLGKLELALDTVNSSLASVNGMLTENRPTLKAALDNVKETSDTLNTGIAKTVAKELDAASPQSLMAKIHASVERMGQSLTDLNKITSATSEVVALNKDNLNSILANFKETSDHMKAATKDLRRNPWRLLYRPTLEETKELNIFDAARAFAEAATRLDDATAKLKALSDARGGKLGPDDPQLKAIRADLQNTFDKFNEAEAALWKNLNVRQ
jgi:ABC-type transporter Mla subunit MlaD